jgi:hypothetical protein
MKRIMRATAFATVLLTVDCSTGATSSTPAVQTADIAQTSKLQFGVGTATIAYNGGVVYGTNFTATFRSADGHSATLANTPTITGPPGFAIGFAGSPNSVGGILPNVFDQAILTATSGKTPQPLPASFGAGLGPLIGVFGYGLAADNLLSTQVALQYQSLSRQLVVCQDLNQVSYHPSFNLEASPNTTVAGIINGTQTGGSLLATSQAYSQELGLPLGSGQQLQGGGVATTCPISPIAYQPPDTNFPINYYGGPPAWPSGQGYGNPSFFIGYPLGFTDVAAAPAAGKYALDVAYATNATATTYGHLDATATLANQTPLSAITISSATINSDGTGSVSITVPPGLFETIVIIRNRDCDLVERPNAPNDNYAVVTHSAGSQKIVFAANLGPPNNAGNPTPTFCSDSLGAATAYAIGFDYPAYESSYPFNVSPAPAITNGDGHTGQADVTTSAPFTLTSGS